MSQVSTVKERPSYLLNSVRLRFELKSDLGNGRKTNVSAFERKVQLAQASDESGVGGEHSGLSPRAPGPSPVAPCVSALSV